jgi:diaminohydroxyphosphoribosylaminopyrimidine deaminase / 5-amino-6-(5-phosphoribosylamino)uracil reductase
MLEIVRADLREMSPHMARALALAAEGMNLTSPNPRVGCVLVSPHGTVIGEGHTQQAGGPHAEVMALRDAQSRGAATSGATAYVTMEPCSHHGRTGPCCDTLISAGISRVVASIADPNPLVGGQGFDKLRAAGIVVEVGSGAQQSRELNIGFFSRMIRKKPWVRMKIAASLDGRTALNNGASQWITSAPARADGHVWRARSCAILTGTGTVFADDPQLTVRHLETVRQPHVVLIDSRLEVPLSASIFVASRDTYIYTAAENASKISALKSLGATVILRPTSNGKVDLKAMLEDLARKEINELHVEAGHGLNGALLQEGLVDEFVTYLAPKLIGDGRGMISLGPLDSLADATQLEFMSCTPIGSDLRIVARVNHHDRF